MSKIIRDGETNISNHLIDYIEQKTNSLPNASQEKIVNAALINMDDHVRRTYGEDATWKFSYTPESGIFWCDILDEELPCTVAEIIVEIK